MEKTTINEENLVAKMDSNIGKYNRYVEENLKRWKSGRQFGFLGLGAFVFDINEKTEIIFDYFKTQKNKTAYKKQRMERHTMLFYLNGEEIKKMTEFENKILNTKKKNIIKIGTLI